MIVMSFLDYVRENFSLGWFLVGFGLGMVLAVVF